jgi:hypothetical protein
VRQVCLISRHAWFAFFPPLLAAVDRCRAAEDEQLQQHCRQGSAVEVWSVSNQAFLSATISSVTWVPKAAGEDGGGGGLATVVYGTGAARRTKRVALRDGHSVRLSSASCHGEFIRTF